MDKCSGASCITCLEKISCKNCHIMLSRHTCIPRVYFDFSNKYEKSRLNVSYLCPECKQVVNFVLNKIDM